MEIRKLPAERISMMSEDEIVGRTRSMYGMIARSRSSKSSSAGAEIELCYLQRELEVRETRKNAHQTWLSKQHRR